MDTRSLSQCGCYMTGMDSFSYLVLEFCRIDNGGAHNSTVHQSALWVYLGSIRCPRRRSQQQRSRPCCPEDQCAACQPSHGWILSAHHQAIHICLIRHPHGPVHCQGAPRGACTQSAHVPRVNQYLPCETSVTAADALDAPLVCQAVFHLQLQRCASMSSDRRGSPSGVVLSTFSTSTHRWASAPAALQRDLRSGPDQCHHSGFDHHRR